MRSNTAGVRFRYQTIELGEHDYHLRTLRDLQQCPDDLRETTGTGVSSATWPLFGILWQAEKLLSTLMVSQEISDLRILEIGCGTGLASIVLKQRGADITATDYNPDAAGYLDTNAALNELEPITCVCADWNEANPDLGRFDLVIGSDLLYDHHNVEPLVEFLDAHVKKDGAALIVDPQRGLTAPFIRQVEGRGFTAKVTQTTFPSSGHDTNEYLVMRFSRHPGS